MKKSLLLGFALTLIAVPAFVFAAPIVRTGDTVSVGADQLLEGDFYGAGGTVIISGEAEGDVYVAGGSVTINAPVAADVTAAGGSVQIHGAVADDVRVVGGDVTLAGHVGGDVLVFAGTLHVLSTATIDGDILFFAGTADISGDVGGSVVGKTELMTINSGVGGDISVSTGRLTLGERTEVQGSVSYTSPIEMARSPEAVIVGEVMRGQPEAQDTGGAYTVIVPFFTLLFGALAVYLFTKPHIQTLVQSLRDGYGKYTLRGLGALLGMPFIALLLMVSVLGSLVGIALILAFAALCLLAIVMLPILLGVFILYPYTKSWEVTPLCAALGAIVCFALSFIPFIGPLILFLAFVPVFGALTTYIYRTFR